MESYRVFNTNRKSTTSLYVDTFQLNILFDKEKLFVNISNYVTDKLAQVANYCSLFTKVDPPLQLIVSNRDKK